MLPILREKKASWFRTKRRPHETNTRRGEMADNHQKQKQHETRLEKKQEAHTRGWGFASQTGFGTRGRRYIKAAAAAEYKVKT